MAPTWSRTTYEAVRLVIGLRELPTYPADHVGNNPSGESRSWGVPSFIYSASDTESRVGFCTATTSLVLSHTVGKVCKNTRLNTTFACEKLSVSGPLAIVVFQWFSMRWRPRIESEVAVHEGCVDSDMELEQVQNFASKFDW
ncbi:hypothetical protein IAQ61_005600 [Plenodomus lingam]|uniref:uncharacterized protein n=1 Tax=Leptosphaeria maculans TaxID=5022 RepID=UPI0033296F69|nr:hypothetical protein IAQ61_005600 [Plenodomus lingam]